MVLPGDDGALDVDRAQHADAVDGVRGEAQVLEHRRPRLAHVEEPLVRVVQVDALLLVAQLGKLRLVEQVAVEVDVVLVEAPAATEAERVDSVDEHDARAAAGRGLASELLEERQLHGRAGVRLDAVRPRHVHQRARVVRRRAGREHGDIDGQVVAGW